MASGSGKANLLSQAYKPHPSEKLNTRSQKKADCRDNRVKEGPKASGRRETTETVTMTDAASDSARLIVVGPMVVGTTKTIAAPKQVESPASEEYNKGSGRIGRLLVEKEADVKRSVAENAAGARNTPGCKEESEPLDDNDDDSVLLVNRSHVGSTAKAAALRRETTMRASSGRTNLLLMVDVSTEHRASSSQREDRHRVVTNFRLGVRIVSRLIETWSSHKK